MKKKLRTTCIVCGCLLVIFTILLWITCLYGRNFEIIIKNIEVYNSKFSFFTTWALLSGVLTPIFGVFTAVFGVITLTSFVLLALIQFGVLTPDLKPIESQQKTKIAATPLNKAVPDKYNETVDALKTLDKLHNDKIITDEEYEQSRKDLMSRLY